MRPMSTGDSAAVSAHERPGKRPVNEAAPVEPGREECYFRYMEFRLLGPFSAWEGPRELPLGGSRQRALLAVLVLRANELVPTSRLVEELWGERPPPTATKTVQGDGSQHRKPPGGQRGETRAPGHGLRPAA